MGSLIEYFKKETTKNVLEKAVDHAKKVQESVEELDKGIDMLLEDKNPKKAFQIFRKVDNLEDEADSIRRDILTSISKGELNPSVRMDLSHLIKRLDDVANGATGVARRISTIPFNFWEQSSKVSLDILIEMSDKTVKCSDYLDKIVSDLITERKHIKEYADHINRLEHEIDLLNIELREKLQQIKYENINNFTIFTVGNTIDIVEAISDAIESVADYIILLLTSENV